MNTLYQIYNDTKGEFANNRKKYPFVSDAIFTAQELHTETGDRYEVLKATDFTTVWDTTKAIPEDLLDF